MTMDKREIIARAIYKAMNMPVFWEAEQQEGKDYIYRKADAILAALKEHGLVIRPREPTEKMIDAGCAGVHAESEKVPFTNRTIVTADLASNGGCR